ncbi:hypothetical protein EYC80_002341 [Monilinia laxa]|uniref:Uncharacterized protein n=1 Tax=Monilinia laxa TaxID=61186 RepID=A0A5N6K3P6_MONLA|nr:hypothetical protein EYC80_002341 [Monilinia laxa]
MLYAPPKAPIHILTRSYHIIPYHFSTPICPNVKDASINTQNASGPNTKKLTILTILHQLKLKSLNAS